MPEAKTINGRPFRIQDLSDEMIANQLKSASKKAQKGSAEAKAYVIELQNEMSRRNVARLNPKKKVAPSEPVKKSSPPAAAAPKKSFFKWPKAPVFKS